MFCAKCGNQIAENSGFCSGCGAGAAAAPTAAARAVPPSLQLTAVTGFFEEVASVSMREIAGVDHERAGDILKSPIFLLLLLVSVVPLAIEGLQGNDTILNGLAIWSGTLWALLIYRLFAGRQVSVGWAFGTVFFTFFIGIPLLLLYLQLPGTVFNFLESVGFFPLTLAANILGTGVREELTKAIPLFLMVRLTVRMKNPVEGIVLGMMSGIGFAVAENVLYAYTNLNSAMSNVRNTGQMIYLVGPIYQNVVRMATTPFFHGCLAGIFGYFIALAAADRQRRWPLFVAGLAIAASLHGIYDALVPRSPMWGVIVETVTYFLLLTYVLKAHGVASAKELADGLFDSPLAPRAPAVGHSETV